MPNYINILPEDLANKIAAGEVIERPASVVKELIENAIDAEAKNIEINIEGAGIRSIRVTDDGRGMSPDDALSCLERHATSKIQSANDLVEIATLGFRGEALPSIASVSRMEILTRQSDDLAGTLVIINGGKLKDVRQEGAPVGTTITVKQLFFNTPARRKFLKTTETELRHITRTVMLAALSHPDLSFKLIHNGREYFNLPVATDLKDRVMMIFGNDVVEQLVAISGKEPTVEVSGLIGRPGLTRKSRQDQLTFVNGRPFFNAVVSHAIKEGYSATMPHSRYPFTLIFLTVNPRFVDVNVHPTKREVRFGQERLIHDFLVNRIRAALYQPQFSNAERIRTDAPEPAPDETPATPSKPPNVVPTERQTHIQQPTHISSGVAQAGLWDKYQEQPDPQPMLPLRTGTGSDKGATPSTDEPDVLQLANRSDRPREENFEQYRHLTNLIQINNCFIIAPVKSGFWVIDQHTAHERILFEHAKKAFRESVTQAQSLLFPMTLDLNPAEFQVVQEYEDMFKKLGFGIKFFGGTTVVVDSVPVTLKNSQEERIFRDIIDDLSHYETTRVDIEDHVLATYACHTAVRAGQRLTPNEMSALIDALFATPQPFVCPHGRPIILSFTTEELEKRFGRH